MDRYGLIGKNIGYSFSRSFFKAKFDGEGIPASYQNFDCNDLAAVKKHLLDTSISGYNVTIPYKQEVLSLINSIDTAAQEIGAVNTIKRLKDGSLKGYNTDYIGFTQSLLQSAEGAVLEKALRESKTKPIALILGTGGASKAVAYALDKMGLRCQYISRKRSKNNLSYTDIDESLLAQSWIIVNCTPLGTFPDVEQSPDIPYQFIDVSHIVYDLVYNPEETLFLEKANARGALTFNGLPMLEYQARASWDIWQS